MTYKPTLYLKALSVLDHSSRILAEQLTLIQQVKDCSILTEYITKLTRVPRYYIVARHDISLLSLPERLPHGVLPRPPGDMYTQ